MLYQGRNDSYISLTFTPVLSPSQTIHPPPPSSTRSTVLPSPVLSGPHLRPCSYPGYKPPEPLKDNVRQNGLLIREGWQGYTQ